jgi:putative Holliday junction resolvase
MVYLGLDLGSKTLGLSISDKTAIIATSLKVIRYNNIEELFNELDIIVYTKNVDAFVLGNPLNLDGSISKRSELTFEFKKLLESRYPTKEVILQDERLSTVEAERMLISNDTKRKNRKKVIDKIAATIILQGYLDRINHEK